MSTPHGPRTTRLHRLNEALAKVTEGDKPASALLDLLLDAAIESIRPAR